MYPMNNIWEEFLLPLLKKIPTNDYILMDDKMMIKIFDTPTECLQTLDEKKIITNTFTRETKKLVHKSIITKYSQKLSYILYIKDVVHTQNKITMENNFNKHLANTLGVYIYNFNEILNENFTTLQEHKELLQYQMCIGEILNEFDYINNLTNKMPLINPYINKSCIKCSSKIEIDEVCYLGCVFMFCKKCITKGIKCNLTIDSNVTVNRWTILQYLQFNCNNTNIYCEYCRNIYGFNCFVPHSFDFFNIVCVSISLCSKCFINIWKNMDNTYNIINTYKLHNDDILIDLVKLKGNRIYSLLREIYTDHFPTEIICYICELIVNLQLFPTIM